MVLATFAGTKVARLPGRDPASVGMELLNKKGLAHSAGRIANPSLCAAAARF